jgi:hypothetical protein
MPVSALDLREGVLYRAKHPSPVGASPRMVNDRRIEKLGNIGMPDAYVVYRRCTLIQETRLGQCSVTDFLQWAGSILPDWNGMTGWMRWDDYRKQRGC